MKKAGRILANLASFLTLRDERRIFLRSCASVPVRLPFPLRPRPFRFQFAIWQFRGTRESSWFRRAALRSLPSYAKALSKPAASAWRRLRQPPSPLFDPAASRDASGSRSGCDWKRLRPGASLLPATPRRCHHFPSRAKRIRAVDNKDNGGKSGAPAAALIRLQFIRLGGGACGQRSPRIKEPPQFTDCTRSPAGQRSCSEVRQRQ